MMKLKIFLVKIRRAVGIDFLMRKVSDYYERKRNEKINFPAKATRPGWSIVIVTGGKAEEALNKLILSVESELYDSPSEIIVVGPKHLKLPSSKLDVGHVIFWELGWSPGWITFKKNLGVKAAKYDKVVVCHDYIYFEPGWKNGFDKFGGNFEVCVNKILNLDRQRNRDWFVWDYPGLSAPGLLPYSAECTKHQIISGAYFVVKKNFFISNLLDEKLRWGEGEDVEWSFRIRQKTIFKFNPYSVVSFSKMKKPLAENWQESTKKLEKKFKNS